MSFLDAPFWLQAILVLQATLVGVATARRGWRGLSYSLLASLAAWFLLGLGGSFLVSRLEGGSPGVLDDLVPGAALAMVRVAQMSAHVTILAAAAGGLYRWFIARKPRPR